MYHAHETQIYDDYDARCPKCGDTWEPDDPGVHPYYKVYRCDSCGYAVDTWADELSSVINEGNRELQKGWWT